MQVILYSDLNPKKIPGFVKMKRYLEAGDFKSADVKKIGHNLYRSRLDIRNRLLFSIYQHEGEAFILVLECIAFHAYEKSRFLQHGAMIDEGKLPSFSTPEINEMEPLAYVNRESNTFHILDKVISFDASQRSVYDLQPPMIIVGSAGSGKTALTLEKMKHAIGDILYVTHSPYLVKSSRDSYYSLRYSNDNQHIDFLSFHEFLESIRVPEGRELGFHDFTRWFSHSKKSNRLNDPHKLFEEFKGVLTGSVVDQPFLSRDEYIGMGIKQSIFSLEERSEVYELFESYRRFLTREKLYDSNMLSHAYLSLIDPGYDFIVIDEVQDITSVQLALILKSLNQMGEFIICGDSNQIVHPNFFSWAKVKSFFYQQKSTAAMPQDLITVLNTNYRNSPEVTEVSNRLLKVKNSRFGSIDKESNYLVKSNAHNDGQIFFLQNKPGIKQELEKKTRHSTRFAVIVMHESQKEQAQRFFSTPLIFSVQEAKGLEYENIILFNFVASDQGRYNEIAEGVSHDDLLGDELTYARVKDKNDRSLEIFKFHVNALYVAMTRAIKNLYIIEQNPDHRLLRLIGLHDAQDSLEMAEQNSCFDEWREEAHKLELQGKKEQAEQIRSRILHEKKVSWTPLVGEALTALRDKAITQENKKSRLLLFEYALLHFDMQLMNELADAGFAPAKHPEHGHAILNRKYFTSYTLKNSSGVMRQVDQFGVDMRDHFNHTPLMLAARFGNAALVADLCRIGADRELCNNSGLTAFQLAIEQACRNPKYAQKLLAGVYEQLEPAELTLQVDGRLIKLLHHTMEYLLFNVMVACFYSHLPSRISHNKAYHAAGLVKIMSCFPDSVLPAFRKKQSYVSSMLSKNEREREDRYNRKIFKRIRRGQYVINPKLSIRVGEQWVNIYDHLDLERLGCAYEEGRYADDWNRYNRQLLASFRQHVKCDNEEEW